MFSKTSAAVIFDRLPTLVSCVDRNFRYLYVNSTYKKWFGRSAEETINGLSIRDVIGAEAFKIAEPQLKRALQGETVEFESSIPRAVKVTYIPELGSDGKVEKIYTIVEDISQLKAVDANLKESELRLYYALEATGEGVWDWDIPNSVVHHNAKWCELLGLSKDYLTHSLEEFSIRIHEDDKNQVMALLKDCLEKDQPYRSEHRLLCGDGRCIWVLDRGKIVQRDSQGRPLRMVGSFQDITEMRDMQLKMVNSTKFASIGEMAAGITHEINNPLAVIVLKARTLKDDFLENRYSTESVVTELDHIAKNCRRISRIITGLKALSSDGDSQEFSEISVSQALEDTLAICGQRFKNNNIELKVQSDNKDYVVRARPVQFVQVLVNLLNNAYDAVENLAEKWVEISVSEREGFCSIAVTDAGFGVDKNIQSKIMQPFFSTKRLGRGTGLGLSISHSIAIAHGGDLRYDQQSKRTKFILELPIFKGAKAS